jgi:hypothetical protein
MTASGEPQAWVVSVRSWLSRVARSLLELAGLALVGVAAFDLSMPAGLVVTGVSSFVAGWVVEP